MKTYNVISREGIEYQAEGNWFEDKFRIEYLSYEGMEVTMPELLLLDLEDIINDVHSESRHE